MASANQRQEDIQPGQPVKFVVECMRYRGEYLGDDDNGNARVQIKKGGIVLVDKAILRLNEKETGEANDSVLILFEENSFEIVTNEKKHYKVDGHVAMISTGLGFHCQLADDCADKRWIAGDGSAQTHETRDRWIVTHLESGCSIGPWFYDEQHVRSFIHQIVPLTNWLRSSDEILTAPEYKALSKKINAVFRAVTDDYGRYETEQ